MNLVQEELREAAKDPELARMYAKKNCRHCRGKGMIIRSWPGIKEEITESCLCVPRGIKKALDEANG